MGGAQPTRGGTLAARAVEAGARGRGPEHRGGPSALRPGGRRGRDAEQVKLARGLLSDSQTKAIFRQGPAELWLVRELCQLNERETAIVAALPKGCALWKVGNRSFQVEHVLSAWEREITWTDERMAVR